ncbi:YfbM family protein [Streptomyces sp. NBC_00090]|uniref:DUF1877 family protein n=1 Tax=Streptomyces sp. NBC_00090 TaxID=2903619 RepID=UPI003255B177
MLNEVLTVTAVDPHLADARVVGGDLVEQRGAGNGVLRAPYMPQKDGSENSMSLIIRLFRLQPKELEAMNAESVLAEVPLKSDEERFTAAQDAGLLLDLSKEWEVVHAAFTGGSPETHEAGYQPVLGGAFLGRTETEVLVALRPDDVRRVSDHLATVDPGRRVNDSLDAMASAFGDEIGEKFARYLATVLRDVASFYAEAASNGDAVVKIAYS